MMGAAIEPDGRMAIVSEVFVSIKPAHVCVYVLTAPALSFAIVLSDGFGARCFANL
jgi:hypothetical protein